VNRPDFDGARHTLDRRPAIPYSLYGPARPAAALDSLRAELNMPPLAEYLRMVEEAYGMKVERWELTR